MKLKSKYNFQGKFSFKPVPVKYIESIIKNIPNNKVAGGKYLYMFLNNPVLLTNCQQTAYFFFYSLFKVDM